MSDTLFKVVGFISIIICLYLIFMTELARRETQTHWGTKNCELSEISPDFTPQEKADCRIARKK
jgi:hypothetical protein